MKKRSKLAQELADKKFRPRSVRPDKIYNRSNRNKIPKEDLE